MLVDRRRCKAKVPETRTSNMPPVRISGPNAIQAPFSFQVFKQAAPIHNGVATNAIGTPIFGNRSARTPVSSFQIAGK